MHFWSLKANKLSSGNSAHRSDGARTTSYEAVRALQHKLVELRSQDLIEDTVLFLEHDAVVTQGRGLQRKSTGLTNPAINLKEIKLTSKEGSDFRHFPVPKLPEGITFAESERGGDLTFHGPGQLVIYPICKLDGKGLAPFHDVAGFIRKMERLLMTEIDARLSSSTVSRAKGAKTESVPDATGVWIHSVGEDQASKKIAPLKIASLGIAVRKWVTYHGLSLNCVNDLAPFQLISPCGFSPEVMTRLSDWVSLNPKTWREEIEVSLAQLFTLEAMDGEKPIIESLELAELELRLSKIETDARALSSGPQF